MTLPRLTDIEQRAQNATEGPWRIWEDLTDGGFIHVGDEAGVIPEGEISTPDGIEVNPVAKCYIEPDADFIAHSRADIPALTAAIRAVLELHKPIEALNTHYYRMQRVCTGCGTDDGNWQTWPCPTVKAITEHLDVNP